MFFFLFQDICTFEGLRYIAGYLLHKAQKKFPSLDMASIQKEGQQEGWIELKSGSSLKIPSSSFLEKILSYEKMFIEFHGDEIDFEPKPMERLVMKILGKEGSEVSIQSKYIIELFVKVRFFQRIKILNEKLKKHESIRCLKQKGQFMY